MTATTTDNSPASAAKRLRERRVLPGFRISLGLTLFYLTLIVLIPLSALMVKTATLGPRQFWETVSSPSVVSAYWVSFAASLLAAGVNCGFGLLVAWVLTRYHFPGRRAIDALIDIPFALPTAVAGIALTAVYSEQRWVGRLLMSVGFQYPWARWVGFGGQAAAWWPLKVDWYDKVASAPLGVVVALIFVGLPFVVRTVQPVLEDLGAEVEEAAASLGASRWQTFRKVILPEIRPAMITGFALAFARGLGEYGSVIFISGNRRFVTQIAPKIIIEKLDQYNYSGATAIAVVLLGTSFVILLGINSVQRYVAKRGGR